MKKTLIAAALVLASFAAAADTAAKSRKEVFCQLYEVSASLAMTLRQYGHPLSYALKKLEGIDGFEEAGSHDLFKGLVMEAYEQPVFATERYRKSTINEFASQNLLFCLKNIQN